MDVGFLYGVGERVKSLMNNVLASMSASLSLTYIKKIIEMYEKIKFDLIQFDISRSASIPYIK